MIKKVVPLNIDELLTPLGLCYWICDDGSFCKRDKAITLNTKIELGWSDQTNPVQLYQGFNLGQHVYNC
jgi:hypothetical protein